MLKKPIAAEARSADVLAAIAAIERFIADVDYTAFASDRKTTSAIERQLTIVAEGMTKLAALEANLPEKERFENRFPHVDVRGICDLSDRIIHEYDEIDRTAVWKTITGPELKVLREALLKNYGRK